MQSRMNTTARSAVEASAGRPGLGLRRGGDGREPTVEHPVVRGVLRRQLLVRRLHVTQNIIHIHPGGRGVRVAGWGGELARRPAERGRGVGDQEERCVGEINDDGLRESTASSNSRQGHAHGPRPVGGRPSRWVLAKHQTKSSVHSHLEKELRLRQLKMKCPRQRRKVKYVLDA